MNEKYKRYLVTSALPYANGPVHIGHLAGVYIPSDIYTRYLRLRGCDVVSVCGSDEHGVPITIKARKEGITPQQVVDRYHELIKRSFERFGMSFDIYSRTSSPMHAETASEFFRKLYDEGKFIEQTSEQYYDTEAKTFLADRYIVGTCPKCGNDRAYGDQCEKCGSTLSPDELIEPHSAVSGSVPEKRMTKHWYLPLNEYEAFLRRWILDGHKEWKSNVYGQCKSWLDGGLQPRAVSRDLDWGIPVPVEGAEGKVLYVWFDAPIGYISATKELTPDWECYWKSDDTKMVHFIGKDNIVFHCIVFPSMLQAHGGYILPENVPANEFLNLEGDKISTSRNWAIWLHEYLDEFPGKEDVLRYVLCANAPETKDNDFTWKDFQSRNNSELVAVLGNFINRALVLTKKYYNGRVPEAGELTDYDRETLAEMAAVKSSLENNIETYHFREALKDAMNIARIGNKYLADTEPWKVVKSDPKRVETILHIALQITANTAIAIEPFMPFSAAKILRMLAVEKFGWERLGASDLVPAGHTIGEPELLFEKIEDDVIQRQLDKLAAIKAANLAAEASQQIEAQKETVSFDDFQKMDIRVATVLAAEKIAKTKKLLKLTVDTGIDRREIVSGIADRFAPEELVGRRVLVLVNLAPREMKGILSKGMILMAEDATGALRLLQPDGDVANGAIVG
ncbi:methionine--tRNA ligase [uncultured Alistipes sp.]|uniref:methionine--tRNA ligase n=1 Tax=uncultured Alistipes sp. TaxID=538949 RepID=UPI00265DCB42|nr:methionine--tRNA ligase [uncultured Alistipes sp.]MCX4301729.1 methionine--tRNA ligase [Alistipes sp.]